MPNERAYRLRREYMLTEFDSENLVSDKRIADFYEEGANADPSFGSSEYKKYCNWLMNNISGWLNEHNTTIEKTKITPKHLEDLIKYIREGKITTKIAKSFVDDLMQGKSVSRIINERGKTRLSDQNLIEKHCKEVIEENPHIVGDYINNPKALEALIGRVMAKTRGQADPAITRELMLGLLQNN
jgi:aspartyl-tRNA(Asn)/glutamyl-tRNA(Gln) amidotransferase subunit B